MKTHNSTPAIVIIHFAGGNCYSFQFLKPLLEDYHLVVLELPGRGKRINEPLIKDKALAVDDLVAQFLKQNIQGEFVIYGHSMGATLGLLLCEKLESRKIYPTYLIGTGSCGPGVGKKQHTYRLKGEAFKNALRKLGGISEMVLREEELFEYFEPVIRSDFELLEENMQEPVAPLRVAIHAIMGTEEEDISYIQNWQRFTTSKATTELWEGNHFFIYDHPDQLAGLLKEYCKKLLNRERKSSSMWINAENSTNK